MSEITTVSSQVIYTNRWMKLREDVIRLPDGSEGIYGVVEKPHFVVIVPVELDGAVHLVEQYRYPVGARYWEFPQGAWEQTPDADPLDVARGELAEETGLMAAKMTHAGQLFQGYGFSTQRYEVYLAQELHQVERLLDHEEQGLITSKFSAAEFLRMISDGEIKDGTTVATLGLLMVKGLWGR